MRIALAIFLLLATDKVLFTGASLSSQDDKLSSFETTQQVLVTNVTNTDAGTTPIAFEDVPEGIDEFFSDGNTDLSTVDSGVSRSRELFSYEKPFSFVSTFFFDGKSDYVCLKARSLKKGSTFHMRPCTNIFNFGHQFTFDTNTGILRMAADGTLCVRWNQTRVYLDKCDEDTVNNKFELKWKRIRASEKGGDSQKWLLGVNPSQKFEKVRLFLKDGPNDNPSLYSWMVKRFHDDRLSMFPSPTPSLEPTSTSKPSSSPTLCKDEEGWVVGGQSIYRGMNCTQLASETEDWCSAIGNIPDHSYNGKGVHEACCICGGSTYTTTFPSTVPSLKPTMSSFPTIKYEPSALPTDRPSQCVDEDGWKFEFGGVDLGCRAVSENPTEFCERFSSVFYMDKNTYNACCVCGGGNHVSVKPSTVPSTSPTSSPSSRPTSSPEPTKTASVSPSVSPSVSLAPSNYPTAEVGSKFDGDNCNVDSECRNVGVSFCLPNTDPLIDARKICKAPDTENTRFLENFRGPSLRIVRRRSTEIDTTIMQDLLDSPYRPYADIHQAHRGGVLKSFANSGKFNIIGHSWGAIKLSSSYFITENTWLKVRFSVKEKSEGHALCLDFDAIASDSRKCIFLGGSSFDYTDQYNPTSGIDLQNSKIVNLALGMQATQSSTNVHGVSDASKAVDGFIDPQYKEFVDFEKNSVSLTSDGTDEWWEVMLPSIREISRLIVHKATEFELDKLNINICVNDCLHHKIFTKRIETQDKVIDIPLTDLISGNKIRIEKIGAGILGLAEVLVFGPAVDLSSEIEYNFPVGNMLEEGISFGYPLWKGIKENLATVVIKKSSAWRLKVDLVDMAHSHWYIGNIKFFSDQSALNEIDISGGEIIHTESEEPILFGPTEAFAVDAYWKATASDPIYIGVKNLNPVVVNAVMFKHAHIQNWVRKITLQRLDEDGEWVHQFDIFPDEPQISEAPSSGPSVSASPSLMPSKAPSTIPSDSMFPSMAPSFYPTSQPSLIPSSFHSNQPSNLPSTNPSLSTGPSLSSAPSDRPSTSHMPSNSIAPSVIPSESPSNLPSLSPSMVPSNEPSKSSSLEPSFDPSSEPSFIPSSEPSRIPSSIPSRIPSSKPSWFPTTGPSKSFLPSLSSVPSKEPSVQPSFSNAPTIIPSTPPSISDSPSYSSIPSSAPSLSSKPSLTQLPSASPSLSSFPSSVHSSIPSSSTLPSSSTSPSTAPTSSPMPSFIPSLSSLPSTVPSDIPSDIPSNIPSDVPSTLPSLSLEPSTMPTIAIDGVLETKITSGVSLDTNLIVTDVIVEFTDIPGASVTVSLYKDGTDECTIKTSTVVDDFLHVAMPPNCIGNELFVFGSSPTRIQVFGNPDEASEAVYRRPAINYVALIQDSRSDNISGDSSFTDVDLYEDFEASEKTGMFRPLIINGVHTSSAISYANVGPFDQDFGGEIHVAPDYLSATLYGNAWKAFKLETPYPVTERTRIRFSFEVGDEAEGHALCLEDDIDENPFSGKNVRCIMVAGRQYSQWNHVIRQNIALLRPAHHNFDLSSGSTVSLADKAVDGNMNTFTNTGLPDNNEAETDFHIEIEAGYLITEVKIFNRVDAFVERLKHFTIYVKNNDVEQSVLFSRTFTEIPPNGVVHLNDIDINEEFVSSEGLKVGMSINNIGSELGFPHMIGEFQVFGKPMHDEDKSFDFHIGDLFPEIGSQISYVVLLQDNDARQFQGRSKFSNIEIYESLDSENIYARPMETLRDTNPEAPRSHVNFGALTVPELMQSGYDWEDVKSHYPVRTEGWQITHDIFQDPKSDCYFADVTTYGFNGLYPDGTIYNNYLKDTFGSVSNDGGFELASGQSVDLFCSAGAVGYIEEQYLNSFEDSLNQIYAHSQYNQNIASRGVPSQSTKSSGGSGPEKAIDGIRGVYSPLDLEGYPRYPDDFFWATSDDARKSYERGGDTCEKWDDGSSDGKLKDNALCWKKGKLNPGIMFFNDFDDEKYIIQVLKCTSLNENNSYSDNHLCVPKYSQYRFTWINNGNLPGGNARCFQYPQEDVSGWKDNFLCQLPYEVTGAITGEKEEGMDMPWWKLTYEVMYRISEIRITPSVLNTNELKLAKQFKMTIMKGGTEVYTYEGELNGNVVINHGMPVIGDQIKIELTTPGEAGLKVLGLDEVEVIGGLDMQQYIDDFKFNIPEVPFNKTATCNDDIEKMRFQAFICDLDEDVFYRDTSPSPDVWWFPSSLVQPQDFYDEIQAYLELTYADDKHLKAWMTERFQEVNFKSLASLYGYKYDSVYSNQIVGFQSMDSHQKSVRCSPNSETLSNQKYYCFEKNESPKITLTYTNGEEENRKYKILGPEIRDQNNYGFVVTGDVSTNKMYPKYISNGESDTINFSKECYEAFIELLDYNPKQPLPVVKENGELPENCKKTGHCVVHFCDNDKLTLSASTRKSPTRFRIWSNKRGMKDSMIDEDGQETANKEYCLQQAQTSGNCQSAHLQFTAPPNETVYSQQKRRGSIAIEEINPNSSSRISRDCFNFPYEWNFVNYQQRSSGTSDPSNFHYASFETPASIVQQSQVEHIDIANDVGGALAVYYTYDGDGDPFSIRAQVCMEDELATILPFEASILKEEIGLLSTRTAAISDSGTVVVIESGNILILFLFDAVTSTWFESTRIDDFKIQSKTILHVGLSTHGHFIGVLVESNNKKELFLYQKELLGLEYSQKFPSRNESAMVNSSFDQVSVHASESGVVSIQVRDKNQDTSNIDPVTFEFHFVCADTNSAFLEGGCQCRRGYVLKNKDNVLKKYMTEDPEDVCVQQVHANMLEVKSNYAIVPLHRVGTYNKMREDTSNFEIGDDGVERVVGGIKLEMRNADGGFDDISFADSSKIEYENGKDDSNSPVDLVLENLKPGKLYVLTLRYYETFLAIRFVTECTCEGSRALNEKTGAPSNFKIVEQKLGKVFFEFIDNSLCENVFTFVRYSEYEEFSYTIESAVSFASLKLGSNDDCDYEIIDGEEEAADNLNLSKLTVGHTYVYCVRAQSDKSSYMPNPYDTTEDSADLSHSEQNCSPHTIQWEASINGVITTEPNAGLLPIEDVDIEYQLLSTKYEVLSCDGCSGKLTTKAGGGFEISFNIIHPYLKGVTNLDEIPVRISFSKTTEGKETIEHKFLCNNGEFDCSQSGLIVYLKHLEFNKKVHTYDATTVMLAGQVFIDDTVFPGNYGCPISNAEVRIFHMTTDNTTEILSEAFTDGNGNYEAPVVIGASVNLIEIVYHDHKFMAAKHNNYDYDHGVLITAGELYTGNDFVDVSQAQMYLEVAGGMCNEVLGKSTATISILGCEWPGKTVVQETYRQRIGKLPAAILEVQISEILDENDRRIIPIWEFFQSPPLLRTINLLDTSVIQGLIEDEEESDFKADTGTTKDDFTSPLQDNAMDEEETIRFQYDGDLKMYVSIESPSSYDQKDCYADRSSDWDSFHVIDYMTVFKVRIDLEHEILKDKIYCDMVDDKYQVIVENNIGMDQNSGFSAFYESLDYRTRAALKLCSNIAPPVPDGASASGPCIYSISHNEEGRKAGVDTSFATGRPNPFSPYTRNMFFSVTAPDLSEDIRHKAVFFIEGLYKKGPGNSFVLPTYEPIMVLRDPPGGSSYASYENVVTTTKIVSSSLAVNGDASLSLTVSAGTSFDGDLCTGGGFGAIVLFCTGVADAEFEGEIPLGAEIATDFINEEKEASNSYSTVWSYTTSDEPARAGRESDVFVVPNLSVMFEEVFIVAWNKNKCQPELEEETNQFANTIIFDVNSDGSKPALSFYSRYHLDLVTIPNLEESILSQQKTIATMEDGEIICCPSRPGSCLGSLEKGRSGRICVSSDFDTEQKKLQTLETALSGWKKAIADEELAKQKAIESNNPISDWFSHSNVDKVTSNQDVVNDLNIGANEHSAPLVPAELIPNAKKLATASALLQDKEGGDSLTNTMRLQIAGDAGMYEMSLSKEAAASYTEQNCNFLTPAVLGGVAGAAGAGLAFGPLLPFAAAALIMAPVISGCNYDLNLSAGIGGLEGDLEFPGVKLGLEAGFDVNINIQHSSTITSEKGIESGISFGLADPDDGDEISVDIYHDPVYNSFVFNTVGGVTKCRWEPGTAKGEDPRISILTKPSQFVFPDQEMIFGVELANLGDHVYSYFLVGQDVDTETSALQMIFDNGNTLDYEGISIKLNKEEPIPRHIRVVKGANDFTFKPVKLALRSACEFAMDYETYPIVEELYNHVDANGQKKLKWLEPCPTVQFAGELKRDQSFSVNTQSTDRNVLSVTVFNPEAGKRKTFRDMMIPNGRLEKIQLLYREVGQVNWRNAKGMTDDGLLFDVDFTQQTEDEYGYVTMEWYIGGGTLPDGRYQLAVESKCTDVGGPDEFLFHRTNIISGNIDFNPPEQFGYTLPLSQRVFFGQEMKVIFTEPIDCDLPLTFDIEMTVEETRNDPEIVLKKEDLLLICENRVLKIQVDYTRINPRILNGRDFVVEVGRIGGESASYIADRNGNPIDHQTKGNIRFAKQFVNANLRRSLTEFQLTKRSESVECIQTSEFDHANDLNLELGHLVGMDNQDRLRVSDISCNQSKSSITAKVEILPSSGGRKLLKGSKTTEEDSSTDLMLKLSDSLLHRDGQFRRLQDTDKTPKYVISQLRIIPDEEDVKKYSATEAEKKEEQQILSSLIGNEFGQPSLVAFAGNINLKQMTSENEKIDKLENLEKILFEERNEIEEERKRLRKEKEEDLTNLVREFENKRSGFDLKEVFVMQVVFLFIGCLLGAVSIFLWRGNK